MADTNRRSVAEHPFEINRNNWNSEMYIQGVQTVIQGSQMGVKMLMVLVQRAGA